MYGSLQYLRATTYTPIYCNSNIGSTSKGTPIFENLIWAKSSLIYKHPRKEMPKIEFLRCDHRKAALKSIVTCQKGAGQLAHVKMKHTYQFETGHDILAEDFCHKALGTTQKAAHACKVRYLYPEPRKLKYGV